MSWRGGTDGSGRTTACDTDRSLAAQPKLEDNGVDAVVLGCTEIPLVLTADDLPVPVVDTARCHAEALFEQARR